MPSGWTAVTEDIPSETIIRHYRDNEAQKILTPDQLLDQTSLSESVYYPNCGILTGYLVHQYGIDVINGLFTCPPDLFRTEFGNVTGDSWEQMSSDYSLYLSGL
ncbi:MAG: hypothetical protein U5N56_12125 [Candidatus Marinimicrobia bacterium]|nr:hypothetical protein [Candidatus Neomarinimicrobiota bacterium]